MKGRFLLVLLALLLMPAQAWADKRVALSFDDVPRDRGAFFSPAERTRWLIQALQRSGVTQAVFFVSPGLLEQPAGAGGEQRIAAYARAGHVLANHSWDHDALSTMSAAAYLADLDRTTVWLKHNPQWRPWFRFPYLDEGGTDRAKRDAVRQGLAQRGLRDGYVTADGSDWLIESLTVEAAAAGKRIDMNGLRGLYLYTQVSALESADDQAITLLGRSPIHVMLLHETDLAALYIADLVAELRRLGWKIVPIDQAYADPLGRIVPDPGSAEGTQLDMLADERKLDQSPWPTPLGDETVRFLFDSQVLGINVAPAGAQ